MRNPNGWATVLLGSQLARSISTTYSLSTPPCTTDTSRTMTQRETTPRRTRPAGRPESSSGRTSSMTRSTKITRSAGPRPEADCTGAVYGTDPVLDILWA